MLSEELLPEQRDAVYWRPIFTEDKIIFAAANNTQTVLYDMAGNKLSSLSSEINKLLDRYVPDEGGYLIPGSFHLYEDTLYISTATNGQILAINLKNCQGKLIQLGDGKKNRLSLRGANSAGLWITDRNEKEYLFCAPWGSLASRKAWRKYPIWDECPGNYTETGKAGWCGFVFEMENCYVVEPTKIPRLFRIDKKTDALSTLADAFWDEGFHSTTYYDREKQDIRFRTLKIDERHLLIQRFIDGKFIKINVDNGSYTSFYIDLNDKLLDRLLQTNNGFYFDSANLSYRMKESAYFPMNKFLKGMDRCGYKDESEKQMRIVGKLAPNLDGSCGKKVHAFIMQQIKRKTDFVSGKYAGKET